MKENSSGSNAQEPRTRMPLVGGYERRFNGRGGAPLVIRFSSRRAAERYPETFLGRTIDFINTTSMRPTDEIVFAPGRIFRRKPKQS